MASRTVSCLWLVLISTKPTATPRSLPPLATIPRVAFWPTSFCFFWKSTKSLWRQRAPASKRGCATSAHPANLRHLRHPHLRRNLRHQRSPAQHHQRHRVRQGARRHQISSGRRWTPSGSAGVSEVPAQCG